MTAISVTLNGILNNPGSNGDHDNATKTNAVAVMVHWWNQATEKPELRGERHTRLGATAVTGMANFVTASERFANTPRRSLASVRSSSVAAFVCGSTGN